VTLFLDKICKEDWAKISPSVHNYSFGTTRAADMDRISYALLIKKSTNIDEELCSYATIIELDGESAYMQHGGNFKDATGSVLTLRSYLMILNYLKENYKHVSTRIWNKNRAMLKLAWAGGFMITGLDVHKNGNIFLIHELEMGAGV
jgi:hypothetical protein